MAWTDTILLASRATPILKTRPNDRAAEGAPVGELVGIARFRFHPGKLEDFKRLSAKAMEIVRTKDTGTLQYDVYLNRDQSEAIVIERYRDSEAALEHAANVAELMDAVLATGSVYGEILGEPTAELAANLEDGPVQLFRPFLSMEKPG
jgi:quinol monooxygenase YgiN